jgi:hypothetical protein
MLFAELISLKYIKNILDYLNDSGLSECDTVTVFVSRWLLLMWRNLLPDLPSVCQKKISSLRLWFIMQF